jgi:hypothetical protein
MVLAIISIIKTPAIKISVGINQAGFTNNKTHATIDDINKVSGVFKKS